MQTDIAYVPSGKDFFFHVTYLPRGSRAKLDNSVYMAK